MNDINDLIYETKKKSIHKEELVEKILRSMFDDVQKFTSKKQGFSIHVPQVGTFVFRAGAIPNYAHNQKGTLVHWISRLFIGEHKNLPKTIQAAKNNIIKCFYNLKRVSAIKQEYITKHATYRPKTKAYLLEDDATDPGRMDEYINLLRAQLFAEKDNPVSEEDLQDL